MKSKGITENNIKPYCTILHYSNITSAVRLIGSLNIERILLKWWPGDARGMPGGRPGMPGGCPGDAPGMPRAAPGTPGAGGGRGGPGGGLGHFRVKIFDGPFVSEGIYV